MEKDKMQATANIYKDLQSYTESDAPYFKGRDTDIQQLCRLIQLNNAVVCYAESGEGKSSLIDAGVCPNLRAARFIPIHIRFENKSFSNPNLDFNTYVSNEIYAEIDKLAKANNTEFRFIEHDDSNYTGSSVWWMLHACQLTNGYLDYIPFLIFDQFEEVFNNAINAAWTDRFIVWLKKTLADSIPAEIESRIAEHISLAPNFKVIVSIRSDAMGELDYWCAQRYYIPQLLNARFCLKSLTLKGAKEVIQLGGFDSTTQDDILRTLNDTTIDNEDVPCISALMLSIVCSTLYSKPHTKIVCKTILDDFFNQSVKKGGLSDKQVETLETVLVSDGGHRTRIPCDDKRIKGIDIEALKRTHLIKSMPVNGNNCIELVHDALCAVVVEHNRVRTEQNKHKREQMRMRLITLLIAIAAAAGIGYISYLSHKKEKEVIIQAQQIIKNGFGEMVTFDIQEDSLSVTNDDKWEIEIMLKWSDAVQHDSTIVWSKDSLTKHIEPIFIKKGSDMTVWVKFLKNDIYMPFDNSVNKDSIYTPDRLKDNGNKVTIKIKKNVTTLTGRAIVVCNKDTIPVRDEYVYTSTGFTKTDVNGYYTLRIPADSPDKKPTMFRKELGLKTPNNGDFTFALGADTAAFKHECDSIYNEYEKALHAATPHLYRHTFHKENSEETIEFYYTKPDTLGRAKGYFYYNKPGVKEPYWTYFLGEGQMGKWTNGLRNIIFVGKDCAGNKAILRSLIIKNDVYIYLYLTEKDQIFINKIEGLNKQKKN